MTPKSRWLAYVLAGALVMVSVAAVAYAIGVSNRSNNAAPAAQSTSIPANPGMGQGGMGQGGWGRAASGRAAIAARSRRRHPERSRLSARAR